MCTNKQKTILLVEDNGIIALEQKRTLEKYGFNVITSYNGLDAINAVKTVGGIQLILMDINLPGAIDGTEAAIKILEKHDLPLVFLSSHTEQDVVEKTEGITSYGYIVKDSGERVLIASIKMAFKLFEATVRAKEREKALQESEHRFRTSIENMLDCFGIYSAVRDTEGRIIDFRVEYVNKAACENNLLSPEEQVGKNLSELFPAHKTAGLFNEYCDVVEYNTIFTKESYAYEDMYGMVRLARVYDIRAVKLGDGFALSWRDISERRKAELLVKENEEKFFRAFHHSPTILAISSLEDERFIEVNQRFLEMTGYTRDEVIGRTAGELGLFPVVSDKTSVMKEIRDHGMARGVEVHLKRKDGKMILGLFSAQMVSISGVECWVTMMEDITNRKQIENELRKRTDELQAILDHIPVMIAYLESNGHNRWVNRCWEQTLGWPLNGMDNRDILSGLCTDTGNRQAVSDRESASPLAWNDLQARSRDGRLLDTSWAKIPLPDGSNIAIGIDVTDRKLFERVIKNLLADKQK